jgi:hypothetical protein
VRCKSSSSRWRLRPQGVSISTLHNRLLWLRPFSEIEKRVPKVPTRCLPGRIAFMAHPVNAHDGIVLPEREWHWPDIGVVADSGVSKFKPGQVLVLRPEAGAFYPAPKGGWDGWDSRELRIIGVGRSWRDVVLGELTEEGFTPAEGYALIDREPVTSSMEIVGRAKFHTHGQCLSGEGQCERVVFQGERIEHGAPIPGDEHWEFYGVLPKSYALVKAQRALARGWS